MRKLFIECKTRKQAKDLAPWAAEIIKVDGGYMAFESATDSMTFKNQR